MKRTIAIKLTLTEAEQSTLFALQDVFSAACNAVIKIALQEEETNRVRLHHLAYHHLREQFPELGSQMCCNAIAKASQALKACKGRHEIVFRNGISVHFDKRTYSLKNSTLSLYTLQGRIRLQLDISSYHTEYLRQGKMKEAELVQKGKRWFFHLVLDLPDVAHEGREYGQIRESVLVCMLGALISCVNLLPTKLRLQG